MRAELAARVAWIGAGLAIAWMARGLGLGSFAEPGPGMLACGLGVAMAFVAATGAIRDLLQPRAAPEHTPDGTSGGSFGRVIGLCVGLLVYITALVPVGFPIATFVFLLALFLVHARISWSRALAISAAVTVATYALFRYGLGTQLPAGLLG